MSATNEIWVVEGLETSTRRQQKARLAEWKKLFLSEGAVSVLIWEGGYGEYNGAWLFIIEFASATEWGKMMDKYSTNSDSFDNAMESWQKTPVLKFRSGGLIHLTEEL